MPALMRGRRCWDSHRAAAAPVQEARVLGEVAVLAAVLAQHVAQLAQRQHAVAVLVRVPEQVLGLGQRLALRGRQDMVG